MELVTAIIQIINAIVKMVSGISIAVIEDGMDPLSRFEWNRDTVFPAAINGLQRTIAEKKALDAQFQAAKRNIASNDSWHNKAAGLALDPFWMAEQKRIVQSYPEWVDLVLYSRGPGADNIDGQVDMASVAKQGSVQGYRNTARGAHVTVLLFSLLNQAVGTNDLSFSEGFFMNPSTLKLLYPADPSALQGRLPAQVRGDAFANYIGLVYAGLIDASSPVPWWMLGMSWAEYNQALARRTPWPTALQMVQEHRTRQDQMAAQMASRYA